ncbi:NIPSNAP family protein [Variovorax sp. VNK109]|uniref:NIPSNAP family protein n=1 Tax=Variovorax sp. VNK109 TaxID=3400919 RepID=UPI003C089469
MIVEQRTYTLHPGRLKDYMRLFEDQGFAIYEQILGNVIGVFATEIGPLNQLVILAGYNDLNDRMARRAALAAHEGWVAYAVQVRPMVVSQETRILVPAPFSPLR